MNPLPAPGEPVRLSRGKFPYDVHSIGETTKMPPETRGFRGHLPFDGAGDEI